MQDVGLGSGFVEERHDGRFEIMLERLERFSVNVGEEIRVVDWRRLDCIRTKLGEHFIRVIRVAVLAESDGTQPHHSRETEVWIFDCHLAEGCFLEDRDRPPATSLELGEPSTESHDVSLGSTGHLRSFAEEGTNDVAGSLEIVKAGARSIRIVQMLAEIVGPAATCGP